MVKRGECIKSKRNPSFASLKNRRRRRRNLIHVAVWACAASL